MTAPSRPAAPGLRAGLAALLALVAACKPGSEPPRGSAPAAPDEAPPAAGAPGAAWQAEGEAAGLGTIRLVAPPADDAGPAALPAEADAGSAEAADAGAASEEDTGAVPPEEATGLAADLLEALRRPPTDDAVEAARRANREGLRLHRRLELPAAMRAYRRGLEAWPGHPYTNYNLACALALSGDREQALFHLRVLAALASGGAGEDARERLRVARTDPDLESLHRDPDFRRLTGFVPVRVAWTGDLGEGPAKDLVESLREATLPAAAAGPWPRPVEGSTLLVPAGDALAEAMAEEVVAALPFVPRRAATPPGDDPQAVTLVLAAAQAGAAEAMAGADGPEAFVGEALVATRDGGITRLRLKPTGFFKWEALDDDGRRVTRTGRYALENDALRLDFRQVTEVPDPAGGGPEIAIEQGRRATLPVSVSGDALLVDGLPFRRSR